MSTATAGRQVFTERQDRSGWHNYTRRRSLAEFLLPKAMRLATMPGASQARRGWPILLFNDEAASLRA